MERELSALPNVGPYVYKFLALQGAPYIYISRLRVKCPGSGKFKL
jgi:hypothetical protein